MTIEGKQFPISELEIGLSVGGNVDEQKGSDI